MQYKTKGICAQSIDFDIQEGKVRNVHFAGGCNGNLQALGALVDGMDVDDVIQKIEGIHCGHRKTSCPDQLAQALKAANKESKASLSCD